MVPDMYAGHDPRDLPAYPVKEAAHYLRLPPSTLRSWVLGRDYPVATGRADFEPLISLPDPATNELSFTNLVEAHVLATVRRIHSIPLQRVRRALDFVRDRLRIDRPLAHADFETDGVDLFVEQMGNLVNVTSGGQVTLAELLRAGLKRIERDPEGLAARLFPYVRPGLRVDQPRLIVIDPRLSFGRPVVAGTGVPTAMLKERYLAGESVDDLAADYRVERTKVEEALRCELDAA